jgi:hypothetical protein
MNIWPFRRRPKLHPDLDAFHEEIIHSVYGREYDGQSVAGDFRSLFLRDPALGKRVLFMILTWCGEFEGPPEGNEELQRWAGKREIAARIKAAMYADLSPQPVREEGSTDDPKRD